MSASFQERLFPALPRIVEKFGTPFHIYDEGGIRQTLRRMKSVFARLGLSYQQFYAVKALPKPAIMDIIADEGCGFDCSSIPELSLARDAGAVPSKIMFTSNNTSREEFLHAANGGCILNLDDVSFIDNLPTGMPELISFRLNPGSRKSTKETNWIIGKPLDSKYGVPVEQIATAFDQARKAGARRFGLHTMVCSNELNYNHVVGTAELLFETAVELRTALGIELEFLNLGGGIGIPYRPEDEEFDLEALAMGCRFLAEEYVTRLDYTPKIFTEAGRYVTGPHGVLVNQVINNHTKYKRIVGVETAMPALMRVGMYDSAYHHNTLLDGKGKIKKGELTEATIAGPICENCDVLAKAIALPPSEIGDLVVTHDTGAHGSAMGFNYNGRTRPQELLLCSDGSVRRICRAETYNDLNRRHLDLEGNDHVLQLS